MKVIDFEEKRREKESEKRYEYIRSMCQHDRPDLFDQLIAEQKFGDLNFTSCEEFIRAMSNRGANFMDVFEEALFMDEETFYEDHGINWYIAVEEALVFYSSIRKEEPEQYRACLQQYPFVLT